LQKAKVVHPDAASNTSPTSSSTEDRKEWVQLLTAYQILSDARSRHLYDLSRSTSSSSFLRQAAASGVKHGVHEDVEIDLNWNLGKAWKQQNQEDNKNSSTVLDHLRNNLESDWHTALRHAYLGPSLKDLDLSCQLPDCFEADERAVQSTNEVLQLVSGRQELGSVRLRTASMLTESERKAWLGQGTCNYTEVKKDPALIAAFEVAELAPGAEHSGHAEEKTDAATLDHPQEESTSSAAAAGTTAKIEYRRNANIDTQPQILDLYLDGQVIATAISRPAKPANLDATTATSHSETTTEAELAEKDDVNATQDDDESIKGVLTTYFYRGDTLLAQLIEEEPSLATTRRYSASKLLDSAGRHTFSIIRNVTPLVRHITFLAEHTTSNSTNSTTSRNNSTGSTRTTNRFGGLNSTARIKKKTVIARCQRAWLPPSTFWLFKPRSYDHDIGGWVINWAGESQRDHPQWLDPSVLTLVAALDTLDYEKAKQQPYGLFERLKMVEKSFGTGGGGGGGKTEGSENVNSSNSGGGAKKVLMRVRDMLRFHHGNT
jgi:hypothetical protein